MTNRAEHNGRRFVWICLVGALWASASSVGNIVPASFDSEAIDKAIAAAAPSDWVRLKAGTYSIHAPIHLKSQVTLAGAGRDKTVLRFAGTEPSVLLSLDGCTGTQVRDLTLDGANNPKAQQGISAGNASRLGVHNVAIRHLAKSDGFGPHGILFSGRNPTATGGVTDSEVSDCRLEDIGAGASFGCGIRLSWGSSRNRILRNVIANTGRGGIFTDNGSTDIIIRGNTVAGSGGEGLGIEVWGGGARSVIEDNRIDHWLSIGGSDYCAVRRNRISTHAGTYALCGIEAIGSYLIVTNNTIDSGQKIGFSLSSGQAKQYVYWAGNTVRDCNQWGAQFQGEQGGIAYQYLYQCTFEGMPIAQGPVWYPGDEGHGFRFNAHTNHLVFDRCVFRNNGRYGIQFVGEDIGDIVFRHCVITGNHGPAVSALGSAAPIEWAGCTSRDNAQNDLPGNTAVASCVPHITIEGPARVAMNAPATFQVKTTDDIAAVLWDFDDGIPVAEHAATHTFEEPGRRVVTAIAWDRHGHGARAETRVLVTR